MKVKSSIYFELIAFNDRVLNGTQYRGQGADALTDIPNEMISSSLCFCNRGGSNSTAERLAPGVLFNLQRRRKHLRSEIIITLNAMA